MKTVFVVLESYGGIMQSVTVYQHMKDAQTHWEKLTGLDWSAYDEYARDNHEKDEVHVYETVLMSEFSPRTHNEPQLSHTVVPSSVRGV